MRYVLIFWAAPMSFIWGWYFLSLYDFGGGSGFLSRPMHDMVFTIYGNILGIDPAAIPALLARTCIFDTFLIMGIFAFRKRRQIMDYIRSPRAPIQDVPREIA
jgi:Family of unknown function (DUF6105)